MKRLLTLTILCFFAFNLNLSAQQAFQDGEWFKFRIHYGWFNASDATLQVDNATVNNKPVLHIKGRGKSTGLLSIFFKVDDDYQSYFDKKTGRPVKFIRKIDEGGYTKDLEIDFDRNANKATVWNKEKNTKNSFTTPPDVHDMLSAFYYIRNQIDIDNITTGEETKLNIFLDDETLDFKLVFLGRETIKTKFGKVKALKFRPHVLAGRVFKEKESLTFWVSDDKNKIPLKIEAELAVGSLEADLESYKGLKHPFSSILIE